MKRTALLTAIAAAMALPAAVQAQSNVKLSGLIDLGITSSKAPGGTQLSTVDSGNMSTSWFGISGSEDLGGGLTASFSVEQFMRSDTGQSGRFNGDGQFTRGATVGLKSARLGGLSAGRNTTPLFVSTLVFNAFGDSFGFSPSIRHYFISGTVTGDTGWNDSLQYSSPSFGGLSANVIHAVSEGGHGPNWGGNVMYFAGPLALTYAAQSVLKDNSSTSAVDNTKTWQLGGSYDLGMAKLYAQIGSVSNETQGQTYKISGLGAKVPFGQAAILAQWGVIGADVATGVVGRHTFSLGYDRPLSKRTDLYGVVMSDSVDNVDVKGSAVSVGVRHVF